MRRYGLVLLLPLLICGCAKDLWNDVPEFEVLNFTCPVPGSKFLDDDNFVCGWSVLGPLDPGKDSTIHTELFADEGLMNGNRHAPRGSTWFRVGADRSDPAACGQINFGKKFEKYQYGSRRGVFYACATLKCSQDYAGLVMRLVCPGKVKVWINGKPVYAAEKGAANMKADPVVVRDLVLLNGCNRLVVKYMDEGKDYLNRRVFSLRLTDAAGNFSTVR